MGVLGQPGLPWERKPGLSRFRTIVADPTEWSIPPPATVEPVPAGLSVVDHVLVHFAVTAVRVTDE
ncbi:hypothetical protein MMAGJ_73130 [Mycolicibacterium mageritense]|uniref:Uncharacterized protein n=1 Tax=Mycolicibacterium mageritense TaxID=53462 RepID=A0ABM7I537_MYCME|nr:hypothetical protein MMAGJ_73130 [Mycolicibacterium mageritense]